MTTNAKSPFQLSTSLHLLEHGQTLETIKILAGSTVKTVELWEPTFKKDEQSIADAQAAFKAAGIKVRTVHANFGQEMDLSSLDPSIRSVGMKSFTVALDLAVKMGAKMIVVHPSSEPIDDEVRAERMKQAKLSLATLAEQASHVGCRIAVELLPRSCLGRTAEELLELVADIDPSRAGICLDVNHMMDRFASLPDAVRTLAPRLVTLHCSDYDGIDEKHWPPLRGVIDWTAFLAALREINFPGPIHYEANLDGQTPAEKLAFLQDNFVQLVELEN